MTTGPNLKNYTTRIPAEQTASEIVGILVRHGAKVIQMEYSEAQAVVGLKFKARTPYGEVGFRLPVDAERCFRVMLKQGLVTDSPLGRQQARMTAWRILKDWIQAQMAIIQTEMVDIAQVLLPYALVDGKVTLYERAVAGGLLQLALPRGGENRGEPEFDDRAKS